MMAFTAPNYLPAMPEIIMAGVACILLMVGVFTGNRSTTPLTYASAITMAVALALVLGFNGERETTFGGMFVVDTFTTFMKSVVLIGAAATLIMGMGYVQREQMNRFEFPILIPVRDPRHDADDIGERSDRALHRTRTAEPVALHRRGLPPGFGALDRGRP